MKRAVMVGLIAMALGVCTRPGDARRVLENDGYTDVQITGWNPFSCGKDDFFSTGFTGNKNGRIISGTVCSGLLKGHTIRLD